MKIKLSLLLVCVIAAVTVAGVIFSIILLSKPYLDLEIRVNTNGETHKTLNISATDLSPGDERQYALKLLYGDKASYRINLSFIQGDGGALSDYITVDVAMQEQSKTSTLSQLLAGENVEFVGNGDVINIVYRMPKEVGNDAQGAKISFKIKLTVTAEGK